MQTRSLSFVAAVIAMVATPAFHVRRFAAGEAPASGTPFCVQAGQRQLFLDDDGIESLDKLRRTMHRPVKRGAVIRSPNPRQTVQTRTAPVWDPEAMVFKLWVLGIDDTFWQSRDGLHWTPGPKPNLRIDMAVYDPRDPDPSRRFKAPLLDSGFAVSPDGIQWTRLDLPKIQSSDEGNFSYDSQEGLFLHTVKRGGPHGRAVALATSRDFANWDDFGLIFHADDLDQELGRQRIADRMSDATLQQTMYYDPQAHNVDIYNMGVFRYESAYVGLPAFYHATGPVPNYPNTDGFHLVGLVCSRDLRTWQRLGERQPFIGPAKLDSGAYDLTQILPPSAPVIRDDELWFYYTGLKYRANFTYVGSYPDGESRPITGRDRDTGAVCLAVLRRDGFVSLDADENDGWIVTKPFSLPAGHLFVNADASQGELRAELQDPDGKVLALSETLSVDGARAELAWQQGDLADLKGNTVRLRITLRKACLFSYWLAD